MNNWLLNFKEKYFLSKSISFFKKFEKVFRKKESEIVRMKLNNEELLLIKHLREFILEFNKVKRQSK